MVTYPQMNIRLTHCANNFGPYQLPEKLIPLAVTNVLRGRKIPVYGDGLQSRDWLHVLDHGDAVHRVLHAEPGPIPKAAATDPGLLPNFDISARHEVTNLDIARMVVTELGLDSAEWIEHIEDRPNHDRRYVINPEKLETELGWRPVRRFEPEIAETVGGFWGRHGASRDSRTGHVSALIRRPELWQPSRRAGGNRFAGASVSRPGTYRQRSARPRRESG
ncbi:GDP-mannose 4,6-dehydratase [Nocardia amamiensis]|uniref:GDP-mannose 4,6-dehydratase n=1 Tax=Nocardia TaxID=1817 RepID=UPI0033FFE203